MLKLTAEGRGLFERMAQEHEAWIVELMGGLKAAERKTLHSLLGTLRVTIAQRQSAQPATPSTPTPSEAA